MDSLKQQQILTLMGFLIKYYVKIYYECNDFNTVVSKVFLFIKAIVRQISKGGIYGKKILPSR